MNMQSIRERAKTMGIKTARMSKLNLVREIQNMEGNFPCFGTDTEASCDQLMCMWREDCASVSKKNLKDS